MTGLDFGKIQNVVDHAQQLIAGEFQDTEQLLLRGIQAGFAEQLAHPDHTVQRGTDLVAHHGQKPCLGLDRSQRLFARGCQFGGAQIDTLLKQLGCFLQGLVLLLDLGAGALQLDRAVMHDLRQGVHLLEWGGLLHVGSLPRAQGEGGSVELAKLAR